MSPSYSGLSRDVNLALIASTNVSVSGLDEDHYHNEHMGLLRRTYSDCDGIDTSKTDDGSEADRNGMSDSELVLPAVSAEFADPQTPIAEDLAQTLLATATELREIREFREFIETRSRGVQVFAVRQFFEKWTPFLPTNTSCVPSIQTRSDRTPAPRPAPHSVPQPLSVPRPDMPLQSGLTTAEPLSEADMSLTDDIHAPEEEMDRDQAVDDAMARAEATRQARVSGVTRHKLRRPKFDEVERRYQSDLINETRRDVVPATIALAHDRVSVAPDKMRTPTATRGRPLDRDSDGPEETEGAQEQSAVESDAESGRTDISSSTNCSETQSNLGLAQDLVALRAAEDEDSLTFLLCLLDEIQHVNTPERRNDLLRMVLMMGRGGGDPMDLRQSVATESGDHDERDASATYFTRNMFTSPNKASEATVRAAPIPTEPNMTHNTPITIPGDFTRPPARPTPNPATLPAPEKSSEPEVARPAPRRRDPETETEETEDQLYLSETGSFVPSELDSPSSAASSAARSIEAAIARAGAARVCPPAADRSYDYSEPADSVSSASMETGDQAVVGLAVQNMVDQLDSLSVDGRFTEASSDGLVRLLFDGVDMIPGLVSLIRGTIARHVGSKLVDIRTSLIEDVRYALSTYGEGSVSGLTDLEEAARDAGFESFEVDDAGPVIMQECSIRDALLSTLPDAIDDVGGDEGVELGNM